MIIYGNYGIDLDDKGNAEYFVQQYGRHPGRYMLDYKFAVTARLGDRFGSPVRNIIFLEYDGTVNQLFQLEEGDRAYIYADPRLTTEGVFNSEQGAFVDFYPQDSSAKSFFFDSSTYCLKEGDDEWWELHPDGYEGVVSKIKHWYLQEVSFENTIFVRQL